MIIKNNVTRLFAFFLAIVFIFIILPINSFSTQAAMPDFAGGNGSESDPFLIETSEQLNNIRYCLNASFKLISDINLSDTIWQPIGYSEKNSFCGTFDGNNHFVKNLNLYVSTTDIWSSYNVLYVGLFGYATGTIKNLNISNAYINVYDHNHEAYVGVLNGSGSAIIENVSINGKIDCKAGSKDLFIGGVCGKNDGVIQGCSFDGEIIGSTNYEIAQVTAGGISACCNMVLDCNNSGEISLNGYTNNYFSAGGISGCSGEISNCYNTGSINSMFSGGIVGRSGNVKNSYNVGEVVGTYAGGICGYGYSSSIINCFNVGNIISSKYGGGIIGQLYSGLLNMCYNIGTITTSVYSGGIAGGNHGTIYSLENIISGGGEINNCYYVDSIDCGVSLGQDSTHSISCEELKNIKTLKNFDFDSVWTMEGNKYFFYPELKENNIVLEPIGFCVVKGPQKTDYLEGLEELNLYGVKGQIIYSNGFKDEINIVPSMVEGFDNTLVGVQQLTVTFASMTDSFYVKILQKQPSSISVAVFPSKVQYLENFENIDVEGGKLKINYNNGTSSQETILEELLQKDYMWVTFVDTILRKP